MCQAIEASIAVMGPMLAVVLVGKPAVAVGLIVLCINTAHLGKDVFVLLSSDTFLAVQPFVIAGTIQVEDFAKELYGVILFLSFLDSVIQMLLSCLFVFSYQLPSISLTFFNKRLASFSSSFSAFSSLFSA